MSITFNADEALAMAEQIERNGAKFYTRAAEIGEPEAIKKLLGDLAEWEEGHEKLFTSMRSQLTDEERKPTTFDPDGEAELYLQAMADTHVFKTGPAADRDPAAALSGKESAVEIIKAALGLEQDSILFYLGLAKMIPPRLGSETVQEIIDEEIGHVAYLERELKGIKGD
jgi:rubrerythrin